MSKMLVTKIERRKGTSKKNQQDYDFTVVTAYKTTPEKTDNLVGLRPIEISCDKSFLNKVDKLPAICEVTYDLVPGFNGRPQMELTDIKVLSEIKLN